MTYHFLLLMLPFCFMASLRSRYTFGGKIIGMLVFLAWSRHLRNMCQVHTYSVEGLEAIGI